VAILQGDIKLVKSQVMDDVPEGGGAPSGQLIRDGESNAIHPDISEVARAGGKVSAIKVFAHVQTNDTDSYLDGNVIVAEPPLDPNVSITLMSTGDTFDRRGAARNRIESYLVYGSEWPGFLLENHVAGQRVIQLFQRPTVAVPNAGQTLALVYNENTPALKVEQYVRVTKTSSVTRTYSAANGVAYQAVVVSCELSDPLRYDFPGTAANELFRRDAAATKTRDTSVANAAKYGGVASLTAGVAVGDLTCKVDSVFTRLVPSAQTEIPMVALDAAGQSTALAVSGNGAVSYTSNLPFNSSTALNVGNAIAPGTLVIKAGGSTLTDSGGQLFDGATAVGVVDYARGNVTFPGLSAPYTGSKSVAFVPAAAPTRIANTGMIAVTQESRAYNYILTIVPTPAPGSVRVSYRAQGRWYDLSDDGSGRLSGLDASYGTGTVSYLDGTASVTLGALPDVGSAVMFFWGAKVNYINRAGDPVDDPVIELQLGSAPVKPGTLALRWTPNASTTELLAVDDGLGNITGKGTGSIDYASGLVRITPGTLAAARQQFTADYQVQDPDSVHTLIFDAPPRGADPNTISIELGVSNVLPGSVRLDWGAALSQTVVYEKSGSVVMSQTNLDFVGHITGRDTGMGACLDTLGHTVAQVDYAAGTLVLRPDQDVTVLATRYVRVLASLGYSSSGSSSGPSSSFPLFPALTHPAGTYA